MVDAAITSSSKLACSSADTACPPRHFRSSASSLSMRAFNFEFLSRSFCHRFFHSSAVSSSLTATTFLMVLARRPKSRVDFVSASLKDAGDAQMTMVVLELPPSDSCRILVSFESRYGMCV